MTKILISLFIFTVTVLGAELRIANEYGFSSFVSDVNSGSYYSGTTVYLDSDLFLSGNTYPIGYSNQFRGTFDGQGHVISGLTISFSSLHYVGLFGRSAGLTIKNVILDSTCSITSTYSSFDPYVGGIIGRCYASNSQCNILNSVNMASVTFSRSSSSYDLYLGGIVGDLSSSSGYNVYITNCANYGSVTKSGTRSYSFIGGIVGYSGSYSSGSDSYKYIQNCINYGTIAHSDSSKYLYIGGIAGYIVDTYIENCVSAGRISYSSASSGNYIGSVVGYYYSGSISNCYFTSNVGVNYLYSGSSTSSPTSIDSTLISRLNTQASKNITWNKWLLNSNSKAVTFKVNINKGFSVTSQVILLPNLASDPLVFSGWYTDSSFKSTFSSTSVSSATILYGGWLVVVTFNANGGGSIVPASKKVICSSTYGDLPTIATRIGYTSGWYTASDGGTYVTNETTVSILSDHNLYARWTPLNYTVKFEGNGATSVSKTFMTVTYDSKYGELATTTRTGYDFDGWFNATVGGTQFTKDSTVKITADQTLYAKWSIITVYFNANGGGNVSASKGVFYNSTYGDLPTPTRTGYTFVGWYTETPEGDLVTNSTVVTLDYDHILYAHWNPIKYTISFVSNGESACPNITQDYDTPITLPELSRVGYTFVCWCNDTDLEFEYTAKRIESRNVTLYAKWVANIYTVSFKEECKVSRPPVSVTYDSEYNIQEPTSELGFLWWEIVETGQRVNESIVEVAHNHTLCAVWEINTVTFDVTGGDDDLEPVNVTYDEKYENLTNATRTGYTFVGWFLNESSTEPVTNDTDVTIPYPHTLYARWRINSYTVSFDPDNGENVVVKMFEYNSTVTYPEDLEKRGYTFSGWDNGMLKLMPAGDVTITALWEANNYTVTLDVNGGDEFVDDEIEVTFNSTYSDIPVPTREGYFFAGWFNDENVIITNETTVNKTEDHTLYARWNANNCTVILDVNGGYELDNKKINVVFNSTYGDLPTPSRTGYTFVGWYTETPEGILVTNSTVVTLDYDHTLYAHWNPIQYTISFISDKESAYPNITQDYDTPITLPVLSKKGYTFVCWCSDTDLKIEYTAKRIESRNIMLYARWEANNYTVSFDVNGGDELDKKERNVTFNNTYGDLPTPNKTGNTFAGWMDSLFEENEINSSTTVSIPNNHTLYAHWNPIQYTISFVSNGGSECDGITQDYDTPITLPELSKSGYTFVCWCSDTRLQFEYTVKRIEPRNVTLYALWEANNYTVSFDVNGADGTTNQVEVTFDFPYGVLPELNKTGHTFAGWTDSLFGGNEINSTTTVSVPNNHTLYALWTVNKYTMTFVFENMEPVNVTLNYNDMIIYPNENPSKSFHKFRRWCTRGENGEEECNVTHVPDHNLTFTASFDVDSSLVAGTAVGAFAVILFIILIIVIVFLIRVTRTVKHKYEVVGIELEEDLNERNEDIEKRIRQQVEATSISTNIKKKLEKPLKKADKSKGVEEILMGLEVDCENPDDIDIVDSYRTTNAPAAVANAINNEKNLTAAAEYLALLYSSVREQEEYEKFSELYFGMKNVDDFMNSMDEKTICFGGIVSGFTSKKVAIQSLIPRDGEEEEETASMPSGVLFRLQNGMGYRIGEVEEDTEEVLFELCGSFKIESMKEINKDKYIVVNLSFVSPLTKDEMIKI